MGHILLYEEIKNLTISELISQIKQAEKIAFKDLKLVDLIHNKRSLIGVYVIFDEQENAVYVGKTGSRSILERIASHFDLRENAFMNTFLRALTGKKKRRNQPQATSEDLMYVYELALEHKLIFMSVKHEIIGLLESILTNELQPRLNSIRGTRQYRISERIVDLK
ncbi:GIY-YIG nuclease family protein [Flectobacillus sp. BAB-3569]|uniref:GIY-YIG nuclease family protein n=1 Tax=Flectobacillus sp. BAB-3569 TaxID=1509483 RepID=UPI000BA38066|nr:GIY-YIG nuclease family protein [Flectobacillus sp. BAB-3569]PAC26937.1 hypothetical protein BWI92_23750 [Flectobacillus sp. BAB-3569]